eukprot:8438525-Prorocentrum_lima.AAC.1
MDSELAGRQLHPQWWQEIVTNLGSHPPLKKVAAHTTQKDVDAGRTPLWMHLANGMADKLAKQGAR